MAVVYKKAGIESIDFLTEYRIKFIRDLHPEYSQEALKDIGGATREYFAKNLANNNYMGFFGINEDGRILCTSGMLIYDLPPLKKSGVRKFGHILNFYTIPEFRGKGYGTGLMEFIKKTAAQMNITMLVLNATDMGYDLYKKAGFREKNEPYMVLDL